MRTKLTVYFSTALMLGIASSCVDDKYDISGDINTDLTLFEKGLAIPVGSSDTITLDDILDIEESDMVYKDLLTQEYYFMKEGSSESNFAMNIRDNRIQVKATSINKHGEANNPFSGKDVNFPSELGGQRYERLDMRIVTLGGDDNSVDLNIESNDVPDEVLNIKLGKFDKRELRIDVRVENLSNVTDEIFFDDNFKLYFPAFVKTDDPRVETDSQGQYLRLQGLSVKLQQDQTYGTFSYQVPTSQFDFGGNGIDITNNAFTTKGQTRMEGNLFLKKLYATAPATIQLPISAKFSGMETTVKTLCGKFKLDLTPTDEATEITESDLPEFLRGDDVRINLLRTSVELENSGAMPIDISLNGIINAVKATGNTENTTVQIGSPHTAPINIPAETQCKYLLSNNGEKKEGYLPILVDRMNDLLMYIPDQIDMHLEANNDTQKFFTTDLDKEYMIKAHYNFKAPLAFGDQLHVIYNDTINGWHEDLENINAKQAQLEGNIDLQVHLDAAIEAEAIDLQGNRIDDMEVTIEPGKLQMGSNRFVVNIYAEDETILSERLDGICLKLTLTNERNYTESLNAQDFILMNGMKLKIIGGMTIKDF